MAFRASFELKTAMGSEILVIDLHIGVGSISGAGEALGSCCRSAYRRISLAGDDIAISAQRLFVKRSDFILRVGGAITHSAHPQLPLTEAHVDVCRLVMFV